MRPAASPSGDGSRPSSLTASQIQKELGPKAGPRPDSICLLLEAARIPNPRVIDFTALQVVRLLRICPWLPLHAGLPPAPTLTAQLQHIATGAQGTRLQFGGQAPEFFVFGDGSRGLSTSLANLVGLLFLIRLSIGVDVGTGLNNTQIGRIESLIRDHLQHPDKRADWTFFSALDDRTSLRELVARMQEAVRAPGSRMVAEHEIGQTVTLWARDFLNFREAQLRRRMEKRAYDLNEDIGWLGPEPGDDEPEYAPAPLAPLPGAEHLSDEYRAALTAQSTRTRNTSFQKVHAEVLLDDQMAAVVARGFSKLANRDIKVGDKPKWILALLTAATGRLYRFLPRIRLGERPPHPTGEPYLDFTRGVLLLPKVEPPNIYRPDPNDSRFAFAAHALPLPLPPKLVELIHQFWMENPAECIGDWLGGRDPEGLILDCLKQIKDVPMHTREPASLRKWMPCQLFEHRPDLVALMVICGDTFGLSDAALYYYAPNAKELIQHYVEAIWPMFRGSSGSVAGPRIDDLLSSSDRAGAATVLRPDVMRAGFNQLNGRLNVNKAKVLASVERTVAYHRDYTDYLARRLAMGTSHRPNSSLYALTRHQFSLSAHLSILRDKQVDPEHFTRPAATTAALSEAVVDYLVHLRFLAGHPATSATAKEYLLEVCRGRRPLLVYLEVRESQIEARPGGLDDWDRSAPAPWAGLRRNFHRAFALNALREIEAVPGGQPHASLSAVILAQGGHLDAAGHPFDDDAPTAPVDLLDTLRPSLVAVEQDLRLRRAKGFSDQFDADQQVRIREEVLLPPPLADWSDDLAEHERTRKQLQHNQTERLNSALQSVSREAEQWLDRELPLISPKLALVLKAAVRAEHKATPIELRNVVIDDLEMLEVQDRIAGLSSVGGGMTALQVATHNLLSRRIRLAQQRLELRCRRIDRYRLRFGRGMSPFLANNLVAVDQANALRAHLLSQLLQPGRLLAKPVEVACALALYDAQLTREDVFAIATGRLPLHHLPSRPGVLVAERPASGSVLTLAGMAALLAGRYTAEELSAESASIKDVEDLSRAMLTWCPAPLRPIGDHDFLDVLLLTVRVAARVEEAPLLCTASVTGQEPETTLDSLLGFHSRTIPALSTDGVVPAEPVDVDPDRSFERREVGVVSLTSHNLDRRYRRLLRAIRNPEIFLSGVVEGPGRGVKSTLASSAEIRQALILCGTVGQPSKRTASIDIADALTLYAHHLNDRELRGEARLKQSTIKDYLSDIGPALIEALGSVDLRSLSEEDFDDIYRLVGDIIAGRENAPRARAQLRAFHGHLVREVGVAEATIQFARSPDNHSSNTRRRQLLSDAHYVAALAWISLQLDRVDVDGRRYGRWRRALLNAGVVLVLLRRAGLRINECLWLRYRDVFRIHGRWYVSVTPSQFRGLKTRAAHRLIRLDFAGDQQGESLLDAWLEAERLRGAGGEGGKDLLFPHLDHPRHSLGDDAIRRLIQLAFRSSCEVEMTPHELRHLWVTDRWADAITTGLGGASPALLSRRLDTLRVETGHASLTTTRDHYIHHLGLLKLQSVRGAGRPGALRPLLEALSTSDIATVDKAWQRVRPDQHLCWDSETERLRMAVARQRGARRAKPVDRRPARLPAVPLPSKVASFTPKVLDTWLRPVSTDQEFRALGFGIGMDRATIESALEGIRALAASPAHIRLLSSSTRRNQISIAARSRPYHPSLDEAMLEAADPEWLEGAERLVADCFRPALLRQGVMRKPTDESQRNLLNRIVGMLPDDCGAFETSGGHLRIGIAGRRRNLTPQLVWNLSIGAVAARIIGSA